MSYFIYFCQFCQIIADCVMTGSSINKPKPPHDCLLNESIRSLPEEQKNITSHQNFEPTKTSTKFLSADSLTQSWPLSISQPIKETNPLPSIESKNRDDTQFPRAILFRKELSNFNKSRNYRTKNLMPNKSKLQHGLEDSNRVSTCTIFFQVTPP